MPGRDAIVAIIICLLAAITALVFFHKKIIHFLALWMADAKNAAAAVKGSTPTPSDIDLEAAKSGPSSARSEARSGSNKSDDRCETASSASSGPDLHVRAIL
ncbi:hypothetical protein QBC32DRAFT_341865 [Pseudoneurospora amorphoporcata]|uniref:Uncharacterized protein n=1 Tax=Pseudoneurospora amorphoporcata TaxID=241081 RepID=A0AAN6SG41_9PEZI|nr:hypothetical protein QBC32DRAFT_341865 [Pseudoneurospora amorphoporcata]